MKKKIFVTSILAITLLFFGFTIISTSGKSVIIVPTDYSTIQAAIDAASPGDTIKVTHGTYYEHLILDKELLLEGENENTTIIDGNEVGDVIYITASNATVSGFTIQRSGRNFNSGIRLQSSSNSVITGNIITNNEWGMWLENTVDNFISGNFVAESDYGGIYLGDSTGNGIVGNTVTSNRYGVWLERSSEDNIIDRNLLRNNTMGIYIVEPSSNNTVRSNMLASNGDGFHLLSTHNRIYENVFTNNSYGIFSLRSGNNSIYRNNFIENAVQVSMNQSYTDVWNNGCEGNYWSDYIGQDTNGDGIGDSSLPHQGLDLHPLIDPWSQFRIFAISWEGGSYSLATLSNSTIVYPSFNASLKQVSFNVTGPPGATGYCNATVPKSLLRGPWVIFLDEDNLTAPSLIVENSTHTSFHFTYDFSTHTVKLVGAEILDNASPVASAGADQTVLVNTVVRFDASNSSDNIGVVSYKWDFGDGANGTGAIVTHIYAIPGVFDATLTVRDGAGNSDSDSVTISVIGTGRDFFFLMAIVLGLATIGIVSAILLWRRRRTKQPSQIDKPIMVFLFVALCIHCFSYLITLVNRHFCT